MKKLVLPLMCMAHILLSSDYDQPAPKTLYDQFKIPNSLPQLVTDNIAAHLASEVVELLLKAAPEIIHTPVLQGEHPAPICFVKLLDDVIISVSIDGQLIARRVSTQEEIYRLEIEVRRLYDISSDGIIMILGDPLVPHELYDAYTGKKLESYTVYVTPKENVHSLLPVFDKKWLVALSDDNKIAIYNLETEALIYSFDHSSFGFRSFRTFGFSNQKKYLVAAYDASLFVYDLVTGDCIKHFTNVSSDVQVIEHTKNGYLLVTYANGTVEIYDATKEYVLVKMFETPHIVRNYEDKIASRPYNPIGTVIGERYMAARQYNPMSGNVILEHENHMNLEVWNADTKTRLSRLFFREGYSGPQFNETGDLILIEQLDREGEEASITINLVVMDIFGKSIATLLSGVPFTELMRHGIPAIHSDFSSYRVVTFSGNQFTYHTALMDWFYPTLKRWLLQDSSLEQILFIVFLNTCSKPGAELELAAAASAHAIPLDHLKALLNSFPAKLPIRDLIVKIFNIKI